MFRFDPHEFAAPHTFHIDYVMLTADSTANASYDIRYQTSSGPATVQFFADTDTNPDNGGGTAISCAAANSVAAGSQTVYLPLINRFSATPPVTPAGSTCRWNTSGVAAGSYYIHSVTSDGTAVRLRFDKRVNPATVGSASVQLLNHNGAPVVYFSAMDADRHGITLTPVVPAESFSINIDGLESAGGVPLPKPRPTSAPAKVGTNATTAASTPQAASRPVRPALTSSDAFRLVSPATPNLAPGAIPRWRAWATEVGLLQGG